ncbi:hypothetical protein RI367_006642 [Sorochytrium milnesiophthora]
MSSGRRARHAHDAGSRVGDVVKPHYVRRCVTIYCRTLWSRDVNAANNIRRLGQDIIYHCSFNWDNRPHWPIVTAPVPPNAEPEYKYIKRKAKHHPWLTENVRPPNDVGATKVLGNDIKKYQKQCVPISKVDFLHSFMRMEIYARRFGHPANIVGESIDECIRNKQAIITGNVVRQSTSNAGHTMRLVLEIHRKAALLLCSRFGVVIIPQQALRRINSVVARSRLTWSHYAFKQRLISKAEEMGVHVTIEACTSRTCGNCGHDQRVNKVLRCRRCGVHIDRDFNGVRNILIRALLETPLFPGSFDVHALYSSLVDHH